MNIKRTLIVVAVQLLKENNVIRKSDAFEDTLNHWFGLETREERLTREIDEGLDTVVNAAKRMNVNRKFKKIVKNV